MTAIHTPCFQRLDNVTAVLVAPACRRDGIDRPFDSIVELSSERSSILVASWTSARPTHAPPAGKVDPARNILLAFSVPRQVFAQMAVTFRREKAEPFEHINSHLLGPREAWVFLEAFEQTPGPILAIVSYLSVPCLMVDARADDIHVLLANPHEAVFARASPGVHEKLNHFSDQFVPVHHPVAQANRVHFSIMVGRPSVHGIGVCIIQEENPGLRDLAQIFAEIQYGGNVALAIHNSARAECVAHALIHAILQWNLNIRLHGSQASDADPGDHVIRAL